VRGSFVARERRANDVRTTRDRRAIDVRSTCDRRAMAVRASHSRGEYAVSRDGDSHRDRDAKTAFSSAFGTFLRVRRAFFIAIS
jgi:hypothetical protein